MTCTIWETGQGVVAIPYAMNKKNNQQPSDIGLKYRNTWLPLTYSGAKYNLRAGEWIEVDHDIQYMIMNEIWFKAEYEHRVSEIRKQEEKIVPNWLDNQLNTLRLAVEKRLNLLDSKKDFPKN